MIDRSAENVAGLREDLTRLIDEHRRLWLARNRSGGLEDSVGRLSERRDEYV
jgi:hypothetical protein